MSDILVEEMETEVKESFSDPTHFIHNKWGDYRPIKDVVVEEERQLDGMEGELPKELNAHDVLPNLKVPFLPEYPMGFMNVVLCDPENVPQVVIEAGKD